MKLTLARKPTHASALSQSKLQEEYQAKAQKIHAISQLLKAYCLYQKDVQYVVQDNKVIIVDENTGRLMTGRRWSDGLHQAVEAKEQVAIERETQTLATITIQNYFRLYHKLAGMTALPKPKLPNSSILQIRCAGHSHQQARCAQRPQRSVYKTKREKYDAVLREIKEIHNQGRPILVGTISVEVSEHLSRCSSARESSIPSSMPSITSRKPKSRARRPARISHHRHEHGGPRNRYQTRLRHCRDWGLHVIGTERHEARRIDRQLRGRCARQGDPGSSHFFIGLEDDLMRLFGSDRIVKYMEKMGLEEDRSSNTRC